MRLRHATGEYEIAMSSMREALSAMSDDSIIVTDENVHAHWGSFFPVAVPCRVLPPGERTKSLDSYRDLLSWCAEIGASRSTMLFAVGGGVVGDLAGFVAATYMRGIPVIQVPTTLLAQVDAAVGGKVGIDMPEGKNLVGSFYQPEKVLVPLDALTTLDPRHFRNGMAEVVKYGFIMDADRLPRLQTRVDSGDPELGDIVQRCIGLKVQVVEADEKERSGRRAILNFGHTVGHALEKVTGYGPLLHGEAVAVGMVAEARLGEILGETEAGTTRQVRETLEVQGLPTRHEALNACEPLIEAMRLDKKVQRGSLAFSLLTKPGECKLVRDVPPEAVEAALKEC